MDIICQEGPVVELCGWLLVVREDGQKTQDGLIHPLIRIVSKKGTQRRYNLIPFGGKHRRGVRGVGGREWS
jgi:hypothetical protein